MKHKKLDKHESDVRFLLDNIIIQGFGDSLEYKIALVNKTGFSTEVKEEVIRRLTSK